MSRFIVVLLVMIGILYAVLVYVKPADEPVETPGIATTTAETARAAVTVVAENLEIPWDIAFLPDGSILVTERTGAVLHINTETGARTTVFTHTEQNGEGGLLGIVLHPQFAANSYVYLYMTAPGPNNETINRTVRYTYANETLTQDREIIGNIPGATYHDGGRMEFGPDGKLYITTGDATRGPLAQDKKSLGGKILRINDDGTIPSDNPFASTGSAQAAAVWSFGHRNPQGLAWDDQGRLWETEHGPTGEDGRCCHDELNLIQKGGNYGWPTIIGNETKDGMIAPAQHSGEGVWAPASLVYFKGALYFGALKGEALYKSTLTQDGAAPVVAYFNGTFGRIRTVRVGPDGYLYLTTSNRDGRGSPNNGDDKIIRIDPEQL